LAAGNPSENPQEACPTVHILNDASFLRFCQAAGDFFSVFLHFFFGLGVSLRKNCPRQATRKGRREGRWGGATPKPA